MTTLIALLEVIERFIYKGTRFEFYFSAVRADILLFCVCVKSAFFRVLIRARCVYCTPGTRDVRGEKSKSRPLFQRGSTTPRTARARRTRVSPWRWECDEERAWAARGAVPTRAARTYRVSAARRREDVCRSSFNAPIPPRRRAVAQRDVRWACCEW